MKPGGANSTCSQNFDLCHILLSFDRVVYGLWTQVTPLNNTIMSSTSDDISLASLVANYKRSRNSSADSSSGEDKIKSSGSRNRKMTWIKTLLDKPESSDVSLVFKGLEEREIKVHWAVLQSVSPVFESMFTHDFVEKSSGQIIVDQFSFDTMKRFVDFIYTGSVEIPDVTSRTCFAPCGSFLRHERTIL